MTPDDLAPPPDDAIARAARDGLRHLAGSHAPTRLDWDAVVSRARRIRQRRLAAVVAACAIVLASAGAAYAGSVHDRAQMSIAGHGEPPTTSTTTTTEPASTSTSTSTTTTTRSASTAGAAHSDPAAPAVPALPTDLTGTINAPAGPLVVGEPATIAVTLRNISGHPILLDLAEGNWIGLATDEHLSYFPELRDPSPTPGPLPPGEQRTLTATFNPDGVLVGNPLVRVAFLVAATRDFAPFPTVVPGIPPAVLTVIPPGWTPDQPLDPGMGKWNVVMSTDAPTVAVNDSVTLHASITNVGDQPQATAGYGELGFVCDWWDGPGFGDNAGPVGPATIAPGETRVFDFEYHPEHVAPPHTIPCWIGITFGNDRIRSQPHNGLTTDTVTIDVLSAEPETSMTTTTTSTTTT